MTAVARSVVPPQSAWTVLSRRTGDVAVVLRQGSRRQDSAQRPVTGRGCLLGVDAALVVVDELWTRSRRFRCIPASPLQTSAWHALLRRRTAGFASSTPGRCRSGNRYQRQFGPPRTRTARAIAGSRAHRRSVRGAARIASSAGRVLQTLPPNRWATESARPGEEMTHGTRSTVSRASRRVGPRRSDAQKVLWLPALDLVVLPDPEPGAGRLTCRQRLGSWSGWCSAATTRKPHDQQVPVALQFHVKHARGGDRATDRSGRRATSSH